MANSPTGFSDIEEDDDFFYEDFSPSAKASSAQLPQQAPTEQTKVIDPVLRKHSPREVINLEDFRLFAVRGKVDLVKEALDKGVAVDQVLRSGWSALMYAASSGQHAVVNLLLDSGADPNFHKELYTPLMATCASSQEEPDLLLCAKYLLEKGAKVDAAERHRVTALMFACRERRYELVKLLLDAGASVNTQDNRGWTALMWAADKGDGRIVRLLLDHGANAEVVNSAGRTAADEAVASGHRDVAELCRKHNALPQLLEEKRSESRTNVPTPMTESTDISQFDTLEFTELDTTLMGLDLSHLISVFRKNNMDYDCFLRLDDEDLDRLGIQEVGDRSKLLSAVKEIHTKEWQRSSLPALHYSKQLNCPEATGLMSNLALHTKYMEASVAYLRDQIQQRPRILQLGMETASVYELSAHTRQALRHAQGLHEQLKFLKLFLDKVQDRAEFIPADLITEKNLAVETRGSFWKYSVGSLILAVVCIAGGVALFKGPALLRRPSSVLLVL